MKKYPIKVIEQNTVWTTYRSKREKYSSKSVDKDESYLCLLYDIADWMKDNNIKCKVKDEKNDYRYNYFIYFKNKEDAILFKLIWG